MCPGAGSNASRRPLTGSQPRRSPKKSWSKIASQKAGTLTPSKEISREAWSARRSARTAAMIPRGTPITVAMISSRRRTANRNITLQGQLELVDSGWRRRQPLSTLNLLVGEGADVTAHDRVEGVGPELLDPGVVGNLGVDPDLDGIF